MDKRIKSMGEVLGLIGEHMEQLRPVNKPTRDQIQAAKEFSRVLDSYLTTICTCMEYYKAIDEKPDFEFMATDSAKPIANKKDA